MTLIELICYLLYFQYMFHHGNSVAALVVSQSTLNHRNKINAITMLGQVINWMTEIWYIFLVGILSTVFEFSLLREVAAVVKCTDFLLIPLTLILTSPTTKNFYKKTRWLDGYSLNQCCLHNQLHNVQWLLAFDLNVQLFFHVSFCDTARLAHVAGL